MKKLLLLMGLWTAAFASPSEAEASACGEDYQLVPTNVAVTSEPQRDCVVVDVTGSSRPGCQQMVITITNQCADVLQVPAPTRDFPCVEDYPNQQPVPDEACPVLFVGHTIVIDELAHSEGHHEVDIRLLEQVGPIDIHVEFDVIDQAEDSCSAAPGPGRLTPIDSLVALLGLAGFRRRLGKRARRSL
jgi:hypothetical protein